MTAGNAPGTRDVGSTVAAAAAAGISGAGSSQPHSLESGGSTLRSSWLLSLAFWFCLCFSAAMYAAGAWAPAWWDVLRLQQQAAFEQERLVALEREDDRLRKLLEQLSQQPRPAAPPGSEGSEDSRIPLEGELVHDISPHEPDLRFPLPELPWYAPVLAVVAEDSRVNLSLLITAAVLVVYAFGFLHSGVLPRSR